MNMQTRKKLILQCKEQINKKTRLLKRLQRDCTHDFKPLTAKELKDEWMSVSSYCKTCQRGFGWRCKVAPDGVCHYENEVENGKITLINNTVVDVLLDADLESYYGDSCIYCGHPDERK